MSINQQLEWRSVLRIAGACLAVASVGAAVAGDLGVSLELEPAIDGDWRVNYTLSEPVGSLVFARGNGDYRRASWSLDDEGFVLERLGSTDRIRRRDDGAFTRVAATLSPFGEKLTKDYTPFLRFSDGGLAVFTGQFIVGEPLSHLSADFIDGASNLNTLFPPRATLTLVPGEFSRMIVNARILDASTAIELGEGEYVYFGSAGAIETSALTAVTDDAAPEWLRQHLYESMAQTFEYFERRLGPITGGKPFMLTVFRPLEGGRLSFSGGVIGSQLAIELGLGDAIVDSPQEREFMARFFAHESAHLWNNSRVTSDNGGDAWMHEGGAEASSWLALDALGLQEADAARAQFERAANGCAASLEGGPLREAWRRDEFAVYYDCGAVIALATHSLMRRQGQDLFDFWRQLIEASEAGDRRYHAADYFSLAEDTADGFDERLRRFTDDLHEDGPSAIIDLLAFAGVTATPGDDNELEIAAMP